MQNSNKKYRLYLILALVVSALKNVTVPEKWNIMFGLPDHEQTVNNLIYFLGVDIILLFLAMTIFAVSKFDKVFQIIAYAALCLAIGKVADEFTAPYGFHYLELFYDLVICGLTVSKYLAYRRELTKNKIHMDGDNQS